MHNLTRRRFLQASAAMAAIPALGQAAAVRQDADPFGGFTVGIQSYSYRNFQPLEKAMEQIQMLGVRNVELYRQHVLKEEPRADLVSLGEIKPAAPLASIKPAPKAVEEREEVGSFGD